MICLFLGMIYLFIAFFLISFKSLAGSDTLVLTLCDEEIVYNVSNPVCILGADKKLPCENKSTLLLA